tara:strand:- start:13030 stop:13713 length:684 start_codon:yes stop_codon:yes gene_type:complete
VSLLDNFSNNSYSNGKFLARGIIALLLLLLASCESQPNAEPLTVIGIVAKSSGYPEVTRKNRTYILAAQSRIYAEDILRTDKDSRLILNMRDDSTFALGPNSHFVLHRYDIDASLSAPVAQMSLTSGSVRTKTARIMSATRPRFEIRTPLAVIGVRGTDFWSGYLFGNNTLDVAMVSGKGVYVQNQHGSVELTMDGWGTTVIGDSAPQPPKVWPSQKINRALGETTL